MFLFEIRFFKFFLSRTSCLNCNQLIIYSQSVSEHSGFYLSSIPFLEKLFGEGVGVSVEKKLPSSSDVDAADTVTKDRTVIFSRKVIDVLE